MFGQPFDRMRVYAYHKFLGQPDADALKATSISPLARPVLIGETGSTMTAGTRNRRLNERFGSLDFLAL